MKKILFVALLLILLIIPLMGSALNNSFVGSIALYEATGDLYMVYSGRIENLTLTDGGVRFVFEGHTYTYINYFIEIVR